MTRVSVKTDCVTPLRRRAKGERVEDDALRSTTKKMTKIVSLQNVGTFFDASYKQAIRQPIDNL